MNQAANYYIFFDYLYSLCCTQYASAPLLILSVCGPHCPMWGSSSAAGGRMSDVCWCLLALLPPPLHPLHRNGCFLFLSGADPLSGTPPAPPPSLVSGSSGWGRWWGFVMGCFQEAGWAGGGGALMRLGGNLDTDPCLSPPLLAKPPRAVFKDSAICSTPESLCTAAAVGWPAAVPECCHHLLPGRFACLAFHSTLLPPESSCSRF